jgi:hypothetical protein
MSSANMRTRIGGETKGTEIDDETRGGIRAKISGRTLIPARASLRHPAAAYHRAAGSGVTGRMVTAAPR